MLEAGVAPWRSPILGQQAVGLPKNLSTGKPYRGVNVFLLAYTAFTQGYDSSYWLTFQQANDRGGRVRRGEKSSMVIFWKPHEVIDKETGEKKPISVLRYYNVFNANQCEGIEVPDAPKVTPGEFKPIELAESIATGYMDGPRVLTGGNRAFYAPTTDTVKLPEPAKFTATEQFYATMFHELAHSTGHSSRLDRGLDKKLPVFGSPDYSREELVAEMAAAFLCGEARIEPATLANQASYLSGWLGSLKADKKLIISAGGAGQRAADWILGRRPTPRSESNGTMSQAGGAASDTQELDALDDHDFPE